MHKLGTLIVLCALAGSAAAQSLSIDFDDLPVGTPASQIELPGIRFWEDVNRFIGGTSSQCHWVVVDLATLLQKTAVPGVETALPGHASGNVLACIAEHEACTPSWAVCSGDLVATDLFIESTRTWASANAVIGGLGCLNDGGYGGPVLQAECGMNVLLGKNDPYFWMSSSASFSLSDVPGLDTDAIGHVSGSPGTWLRFWGRPSVGSHRTAATTALFIDNVSTTLQDAPDPGCPPPDFLRLEAPFDQHNHVIDVAAGETLRVTWKPYSFPPNIGYRRFGAFLFPVPTGFRYIGVTTLAETATVADITIPRLYLGNYSARLNVAPSGACGTGGWWPVPSNFGPLLQVHDPAPPPRVDSVDPPVAKPGSAVVLRGDGFAGALTVTIGGQGASAVITDVHTLRVTVPQVADGPAEITVTTAWGTVTVPASSGLFRVGTPPPKRRSARH